jgi:hypothetical protein
MELPKEECKDGDKHISNLHYVLCMEATPQDTTGNDGGKQKRDSGRKGERLKQFHQKEQAKQSKLLLDEVAALRLYTSTSFSLVNDPLRGQKGKKDKHPLAATVVSISEGLQKLRTLNFGRKKDQTMYLWRGLKDRYISDEFMIEGGSELGCMSSRRTSPSSPSTPSPRCHCCSASRSSRRWSGAPT